MMTANEARAITDNVNFAKEMALTAAATEYVNDHVAQAVCRAATEGRSSEFLPVYQYEVSLPHVIAILENIYGYRCVICGAAKDCLRIHW